LPSKEDRGWNPPQRFTTLANLLPWEADTSTALEKGVNGDSIEWQGAIKKEMTPYDGAVTLRTQIESLSFYKVKQSKTLNCKRAERNHLERNASMNIQRNC